MHARLRCSKSLLTLYQIKKKPDFPSLADEIAEPRPDMNIKVAAFTVSEKSNYTSKPSQGEVAPRLKSLWVQDFRCTLLLFTIIFKQFRAPLALNK